MAGTCKLTVSVEHRWLPRRGKVGLLLTYVMMKAGAPATWFVKLKCRPDGPSM